MSFDKVFAFILIAIVILLLIYVIILIYKKVTPFQFTPKSIPHFSIDHQFNPYPATININNKYDCNADSLRKCTLDDETTLFGCKELIVRCHHFDKDIEYMNNGISKIIPKNETANEGYALAITTIIDACNPYHGDLTLVTVNENSNEYMLVCTCKNPGYIGNEDILGNCTTVFICNGKIDDINKTLDRINCVCDVRQKSLRYDDGLPVCKSMTVKDANALYDDWTNLVPFNSTRQIETDKYNPTISGNLKTTRLLDPCRNSLHDTTIAIPNGKYDSINGRCTVLDYGLPISNGTLLHHPIDDSEKITAISSDCVLATEKYRRVRVSDNIAGVRRISAIVVSGLPFTNDLKKTEVVVVPKAGISVGGNGQINITAFAKLFFAPQCYGDWPSYFCSIQQYYDHDESTLPYPGHRECPGAFLWGQELWTNSESLVSNGVKFNNNGLYFNNDAFRKINSIKPYGVQWAIDQKDYADLSGLISFVSNDDFHKHREVMT